MSRLGSGSPSFDITSDILRILYHIYDMTLNLFNTTFLMKVGFKRASLGNEGLIVNAFFPATLVHFTQYL